MIEWIKKLFKREKKVTKEELYQELRGYSKNDLVRELIHQSQINNGRNNCGVPKDFVSEIKQNSKKKIIKAIIILRIENSKPFRKIKNQIRRKANAS